MLQSESTFIKHRGHLAIPELNWNSCSNGGNQGDTTAVWDGGRRGYKPFVTLANNISSLRYLEQHSPQLNKCLYNMQQ